jgi:pimeloyl-ACP methyl ester carboxylesterase
MSTHPWRGAMATALVLGAASPAFAQDGKIDASLAAYGDDSASVILADGRKIHMVCMGQSSPTVVLTAGLGDWGAIWGKVQPTIARTTRVCAWDRPAAGFSAPSPKPQTVDNTTADLEEALRLGRSQGPYVMVGHSLGGYESLLFTDKHRAEVAGMVLVDPSIPGQSALFAKVAPALDAWVKTYYAQGVSQVRRCASDLRSGVLKIGAPDPGECLVQSPAYPPALSERLSRFQTDPAVFDTIASLMANFDRDSEIVANPKRGYGALPLVVLTATVPQPFPDGTPDDVRKEVQPFMAAFSRGHDDIAALSTQGVNRPVPGASHYIQRDKPEVVIEAIQTVVAQARAAAR